MTSHTPPTYSQRQTSMSRVTTSSPALVLARFGRRTDGIAAVEFALIVPIILLMMVGAMEMSRAINMDRKLSTVTSMIGDLISREKDMGTNPVTTLNGMADAIEHVLKPYDPAKLTLEIYPVMGFGTDGTDTKLYAPSYKYANGNITVDKARCTPHSLTAGLVNAGGSVIVVKGTYEYEASSFASWAFEDATWTDGSTHSPRHACVDFQDNNCVVSCN
ncbi:MAG: TadE/TadG family type IV pilus assembly protein [Hyphomicrobiaceae bacterium]|nr:TadE/TadG family type IV pilus assembly protein [Hyphomicrobiaceae bacterium]